MDDKKFKEMDRSLMKKMEPLREQKISEGILKGFSASVERRLSGSGAQTERKPAPRLAWAPALAVMVLASVAVLRAPVQEIQLAQAVAPAEDMQDEIAVLTELGVLDEYGDSDLLDGEDVLLDEDVELSKNIPFSTALA